MLAQLEYARERLERLLEIELGELDVVLHGVPAQLDAAQPWLPVQRRLTAPAARRYVVGWAGERELHVLLLRTYRIPRPVTVRVRDDYGGCRSWLEITRDLPFEGTPVLSDEEFERASEEIAGIADASGVPAYA